KSPCPRSRQPGNSTSLTPSARSTSASQTGSPVHGPDWGTGCFLSRCRVTRNDACALDEHTFRSADVSRQRGSSRAQLRQQTTAYLCERSAPVGLEPTVGGFRTRRVRRTVKVVVNQRN